MKKRTCFALVEIGQRFMFIGNPIVWEKVSDFTAQVWDAPYPAHDDEIITSSVIDKDFDTLAIVDIYPHQIGF